MSKITTQTISLTDREQTKFIEIAEFFAEEDIQRLYVYRAYSGLGEYNEQDLLSNQSTTHLNITNQNLNLVDKAGNPVTLIKDVDGHPYIFGIAYETSQTTKIDSLTTTRIAKVSTMT